MSTNKQIQFLDWEVISYQQAWEEQERLFRATIDQKIQNRKVSAEEQVITPNYLIFCSHPPVYTLGKSGSMNNLLLNNIELQDKSIEFFKTNRGGDITFHGPGQIVGYPILDLDHFFTDIHRFLRYLEEAIILTLAEYGIKGERLQGATGVWIDADNPLKARKICAMGIRCSRWVSMHGWAFNINTDLNYFNYIIPCGIDDKKVTSLNKELGKDIVDIDEVKAHLKRHFCDLFEAKLI